MLLGPALCRAFFWACSAWSRIIATTVPLNKTAPPLPNAINARAFPFGLWDDAAVVARIDPGVGNRVHHSGNGARWDDGSAGMFL